MAFTELSEKLRAAARTAGCGALYAKSNALNDKATELEEAAKEAIIQHFTKETMIALNGAWSNAYRALQAEMQEVVHGGA